MKIGAGVILQKADGKLFVVHPTNQNFVEFPKGVRDNPEEVITTTAKRELYEETNIKLPDSTYMEHIGTSNYNHKRKIVYFFLVREVDDKEFFKEHILDVDYKCKSMVESVEVPFPEVDQHLWMTKEELSDKIHYSQKHLLNLI